MTYLRRTRWIISAWAGVCALAISACSPPANQPAKPNPPASSEKPAADKPAAEKPAEEKPAGEKGTDTKIALQTVDLTSFQRIIGQQKGKVVLVDFWATWCGPCKEIFPHTVAVAKKYAAKDLSVVTMSFDDSTDEKALAEARKFLADNQAPTLNLISSLETAENFDAYKIPGGAIPYFQLYDRTGKLRHTFRVSAVSGPIDPEEIDLKIRELVMEKDPPAADKTGK